MNLIKKTVFNCNMKLLNWCHWWSQKIHRYRVLEPSEFDYTGIWNIYNKNVIWHTQARRIFIKKTMSNYKTKMLNVRRWWSRLSNQLCWLDWTCRIYASWTKCCVSKPIKNGFGEQNYMKVRTNVLIMLRWWSQMQNVWKWFNRNWKNNKWTKMLCFEPKHD
jgi:hypothetical protein